MITRNCRAISNVHPTTSGQQSGLSVCAWENHKTVKQYMEVSDGGDVNQYDYYSGNKAMLPAITREC